MKSLAIITCYYGEFPWYFGYFLKSCEFNPTVHFFIVTDISYTETLPKNVHLIHIAWDELKELSSTKLGFEVRLPEPYKLCDYKPAFGYIFSDYIKDFDFWGHADMDIIYGNIRSFITDKVLTNYDIINIRHDVISGYFLLFRNCNEMNELFMKSKDYVKVFTSPEHQCFDESNFQLEEFRKGIHYSKIKSEIESMNHVILKYQEKDELRLYLDLHVLDGIPGEMKWDQGRLIYRNGLDVLLYHMIMFKKHCIPRKRKTIPDFFRISPRRIYV